MTCSRDNLPTLRFPSTASGKAYLIAKSTNLLLNTEVKYSIDMGCAVAPANGVKITASRSPFIVGIEMYFDFEFKNVYGQTDNWQKGILSYGGVTGQVVSGTGRLYFTPSREGSISISVLYTPDEASVYGMQPTSFNTPTIIVVSKARIIEFVLEFIRQTPTSVIVGLSSMALAGIVVLH